MIKKVIITLAGVVGAVVIAVFALNVIMPNTVTQLVSAVEDAIAGGTGIGFDFNGDGKKGGENSPDGKYDGDSSRNQGILSGQGQGVTGWGGLK